MRSDADSTNAISTQPATFDQGPRPFQPGLAIDWQQRAVLATGVVAAREGLVEFAVCFPGKEHESLVVLDASATHLFMALGLIGLEFGHPPQWNEDEQRFRPATGDLVAVSFRFERNGRIEIVNPFAWLCEIEYGRTPRARPWVFAGSRRTEQGDLAADRSGAGLALVDFGESLLSLSQSYTSQNVDVWVEAATDAIPAEGTAVTVTFQAAGPRRHTAHVDFRGVLSLDGRYASAADLADAIQIARRLTPDYVQTIELRGTLRSDAARIQAALRAAGVPANATQMNRVASGE